MLTVTIRTSIAAGQRATDTALKITHTAYSIARAVCVPLSAPTIAGAELPAGELLRVECSNGHSEPCDCPLCDFRDALVSMLVAAARRQDQADREAADRRSAAASTAAQARWAGRRAPSGEADHA